MVAPTLGSGPQSGPGPFSSPPESSDLDERLLDEGQLRVHFARIEALAERREVSVKRTTDSDSEPAFLEEVILPLVRGKVFGAQVRYHLEGRRWLETFVSASDGVRMVRLPA